MTRDLANVGQLVLTVESKVSFLQVLETCSCWTRLQTLYRSFLQVHALSAGQVIHSVSCPPDVCRSFCACRDPVYADHYLIVAMSATLHNPSSDRTLINHKTCNYFIDNRNVFQANQPQLSFKLLRFTLKKLI